MLGNPPGLLTTTNSRALCGLECLLWEAVCFSSFFLSRCPMRRPRHTVRSLFPWLHSWAMFWHTWTCAEQIFQVALGLNTWVVMLSPDRIVYGLLRVTLCPQQGAPPRCHSLPALTGSHPAVVSRECLLWQKSYSMLRVGTFSLELRHRTG